MTTGKDRGKTKEFKFEAVKLANELGNVSEAARQLGVSAKTLYNWRDSQKKHGKNAFPGKGRMTPDDDNLRRLERENRELRIENDILKKATRYLAAHGY